MRSDHLSKHLKTHQAKKVTQQQQVDDTASTGTASGTPADITAIDDQELSINDGEDGADELVVQGQAM